MRALELISSRLADVAEPKKQTVARAMAVVRYMGFRSRHTGMEEIVRCDCPYIHRRVRGRQC